MKKYFHDSLMSSFILVIFLINTSACTLNVNLNVTTDKPLDLHVVLEKPIEVKVAGSVGIDKIPPLQTDVKVEMPKLFGNNKKK